MSNPLWIHYGGSYGKMKQHLALLKAHFGTDFRAFGARTLRGHWSNQCGVVPDTKENRAWIRQQPGISVDREMMKREEERKSW